MGHGKLAYFLREWVGNGSGMGQITLIFGNGSGMGQSVLPKSQGNGSGMGQIRHFQHLFPVLLGW